MKKLLLGLLTVLFVTPTFAQKISDIMITEDFGVVGINKTKKGAKFTFEDKEQSNSNAFCFMPLDNKRGKLSMPTDVKGNIIPVTCKFLTSGEVIDFNFKEKYGKKRFDGVAIFPQSEVEAFKTCFTNEDEYMNRARKSKTKRISSKEIIKNCEGKLDKISIFPFKDKKDLGQSTERILKTHVNESLRSLGKMNRVRSSFSYSTGSSRNSIRRSSNVIRN